MRIAYVITRADAVGGASIHVRDLAEAMLARGHQAMVFIGGTGPVTEQFNAAGVPFHSLRFLRRSIRPDRDLRALFELMAALRAFHPDLISTHTAKAGWIGRAAGARLRVPTLFTPHGWSLGTRLPPAQAAVFRLAEKAAASWTRAIICVCRQEGELALDRGVARPERLHVVYNGVRDIRPEWRATPASSPVRLACVARFDSPKDHPTLLHALARLTALDWQLELIGDGPRESESRQLAAGLGIDGRVRFAGYHADVAPLLARAQLFVLPTRSEAFPRSVLEAMRAGLPVVASNVGGVPEAVEDGVHGLLVPPRDAAALAEALRGLILDPVRRARLGAASRLKYESCFRLETMVARTMAIYESIL